MANEESVNNAGEDNDLLEELKKSKMRTMILGAVTVIVLIALGYVWSSRSKLEVQVQEQQTQIQKMDSLLQKNTEELKKQVDRAEANQKLAAEKAKQSKSTKSTAKKSKTKKR